VWTVLDGAVYGGGAGEPTLGKNLGTKGAGPIVEGTSSVGPSSRSRFSRFADLHRRTQMLRNMHSARVPNTPALPPTAPPNVATFLWLVRVCGDKLGMAVAVIEVLDPDEVG